MISEYFYMPATNKKVTEEDRIKFTQDRIRSVREFLQKVVFDQTFIPDMLPSEHDPFFDQFNGAKPLHADWKAAVVPTHVVINHNWWQKNVEAFCSERRVKIPDIDFFYILMQMCREHNVTATPRDGTMFLSLNKPNWLFEVPNDKESITDKQDKMEKLTVGKLKQLLNNKELHDSDEVFADYPGGWSGVFQVYRSDNRLFLLASDNSNDSGIGGGVTSIDTQLWKSKDLDEDA